MGGVYAEAYTRVRRVEKLMLPLYQNQPLVDKMGLTYVRRKPFVPVVNKTSWSVRRYKYKRDLLHKICVTASFEKVAEFQLESWCAENNIPIRPPKPEQPQATTLDSWAHLSGKAAQDSFLESK